MTDDIPATGRDARRRLRRPTRLTSALATTATVAVLIAVPLAGSASAAPDDAGLVPGTPCTLGTTACVVLGQDGFNAKSWLIKDDRVVRGPVSSSTGGPGKDTPVGTFQVTRKIRDHFSSETKTAEGLPSPMPWAVFFTPTGYAFHGGGRPAARTAGCIRLADSNASYFFDNLAVGDTVQIAPAGSRSSGSDDPDEPREKKDGGLLGGL